MSVLLDNTRLVIEAPPFIEQVAEFIDHQRLTMHPESSDGSRKGSGADEFAHSTGDVIEGTARCVLGDKVAV